MPHRPWPELLSGDRLLRFLFWPIGILAFLGLTVEVWGFYYPSDLAEHFVSLFSLSYEGNVPTWYAASLLFWCGLVLTGITLIVRRRKAPYRWHWTLLALVFFYISLDEAVEIHEHLGGLVDAGGIFYFDWIIPAGIAVVLLGLFYFPFLRHLPKTTQRRFLLAGVLYVGGALVMEMPLGYWTVYYGKDNLGYALIDLVEEVLELVGASLFLAALWDYAGSEQPGEEVAR